MKAVDHKPRQSRGPVGPRQSLLLGKNHGGLNAVRKNRGPRFGFKNCSEERFTEARLAPGGAA